MRRKGTTRTDKPAVGQVPPRALQFQSRVVVYALSRSLGPIMFTIHLSGSLDKALSFASIGALHLPQPCLEFQFTPSDRPSYLCC